MSEKLILDGNAFYEIDEECLVRKELEKQREEKQREEKQREEKQ